MAGPGVGVFTPMLNVNPPPPPHARLLKPPLLGLDGVQSIDIATSTEPDVAGPMVPPNHEGLAGFAREAVDKAPPKNAEAGVVDPKSENGVGARAEAAAEATKVAGRVKGFTMGAVVDT